MDAYRAAKLRLFDTVLPPGAGAVVVWGIRDVPLTVGRSRRGALLAARTTITQSKAEEVTANLRTVRAIPLRLREAPPGDRLEV